MKPKMFITTGLLVFVVASITWLIVREFRQGPELSEQEPISTNTYPVSPKIDPEKGLTQSPHKVIVYYFHGTARCPSCRTIEDYTREAIENGFADAVKNGLMEWRPVNVEEQGNEHFITDYELYTKSVVIVDARNGKQIRWKNLEKVWELLYSKDAFIKYIKDELRCYQAEK